MKKEKTMFKPKRPSVQHKHRNATIRHYLRIVCSGLVFGGGILIAFGIGNSEMHTFLLGSAIAAGGFIIDFMARRS